MLAQRPKTSGFQIPWFVGSSCFWGLLGPWTPASPRHWGLELLPVRKLRPWFPLASGSRVSGFLHFSSSNLLSCLDGAFQNVGSDPHRSASGARSDRFFYLAGPSVRWPLDWKEAGLKCIRIFLPNLPVRDSKLHKLCRALWRTCPTLQRKGLEERDCKVWASSLSVLLVCLKVYFTTTDAMESTLWGCSCWRSSRARSSYIMPPKAKIKPEKRALRRVRYVWAALLKGLPTGCGG